MNRVLALILAGGASERLGVLTAERAKPAVPFGGKYRIIDFVLSNCSNSGIRNVAVLTQFNPRSLAQHIGIGRPWDLDRSTGGVVLLQPYLSRTDHDWYKGTADAVQALRAIAEKRAKFVSRGDGSGTYEKEMELWDEAGLK
ncbi:MAG: sugar phosphate nucleotidyltransferase, partial [Dehalococcoidia bacterium]|nr:sugar phosphate nucleotidyltransferase [Dehalococcoidia bacterium]